VSDKDALLAAIIESARDYALVTVDLEGRITSWNTGAAQLHGWTEDEVLGRSGDLIFTADDLALGAADAEKEIAAKEGRAEGERWYLRKDGSCFWGSGLLLPLKGNHVSGFLKIMRDRTEQRRSQEALRASELRFRTLAEHIPQLIWRSRSTGERTWGSPQWARFTGLSVDESLGLGWLQAIHPSDRPATLEAWRAAERRGEFHIEHRTRRQADGEYRWLQSRATRMTDEDGKTLEWFGTSTDVHELRRMQEQQHALLLELHHRSRNLLAIVNSIARRTAATSASVSDFEERFLRRVAALARVQGLASREDRAELDLAELVVAEVAAHVAELGNRLTIDGAPVKLRERAAEIVALALHELATNAVKHGALAGDAGHLSITWYVRNDGWLVIRWHETGVVVAEAATARRGYGRELLEVALPHALGARTRFELKPDGLLCSIELPEYERDRSPNG
jgi:PAS domain S-box-containing protein